MQSYSSSLIDLSFLNSISRGNTQTMLKYINIFLEDVPPQISMLEKAIELKEWDTAESIAHALKSQLNFVGAKSISLIAGKIKDAAQTGAGRNLLAIQSKELKILFQSACEELINIRTNLNPKS